MEQNPRIAFLGVGLMGAPMTSRLLDAGLQLPFTKKIKELFQALIDIDQGGAYDQSAVLLELERINAPKRIGIVPNKVPN